MMAAGTVRALGVLLRRHPAAVAEAVGAGLLRAGRVGLGEFKDWLDDTPAARTPPARSTARLGPEERRRLLRFLKREARRDAATGTPPAEEAMHRHR
jgi:hypothetical protein